MELRDYVKVVRNRAWLIIGSILVVTLGAIVLSFLQRPSYEGTALVLVAQQTSGSAILGTPQPQQSYQAGRDDVQTQVEIIQSRRIAQDVITTLHLADTVDLLQQRVSVSADTGTNNIIIRATDPSPQGAARLANAFANAYVTWSKQDQTASIKAAATDVERRLAEAQTQITAIEATATPSEADSTRLAAARSLYSTLAEKLQELQIAEQLASGMGSVLSSAAPDPIPVSPKHTRDALLGLSIGLLIGLGAAFVVEQLDTRIKSADEVGEIYGAPVLASIPVEKVDKAELERLTLTERPNTAAAEAYRMLRNNLGFVNFDKGIKTVLVTSAAPSEGKSTVAANLASVLSQAGNRVALVVCDFYLPAAERFFDLGHATGLSSVLAGTQQLAASLRQPADFPNLIVLTSGVLPPNPSELLGSSAMCDLVAQLRESCDWVILDSAPVLAAADAASVARWVDGVLIVARLGTSKRDAAKSAKAQLQNVGARILGVAAWGAMDTSAHAYYGYGAKSRDGS